MYLSFFLSCRETVLVLKSQSKPMKGTLDPNGMSFDRSQGMPSLVLISSTSLVEYAYSLLRGSLRLAGRLLMV